MGFTFVAADWFRNPVVLSGGASRHSSVTGPFDRVSSNSVGQTFTAVVDVFIGAHLKTAVELINFNHGFRRSPRIQK